ncbi:MAG: sulfur oxidation c-type cytochrome SoxA [Pseudomonadota bacterium]
MTRRAWKYCRRPRLVAGGVAALAAVIVTACATFGSHAQARDGVRTPVTPPMKNHPLDEVWSGKRYASETARALHDAREENPANGVVADGTLLWRRVVGSAGKSCASCHNDPAFSMRSAGTRYPKYFSGWQRPITLEDRINRCRDVHMRAERWPRGARSLIAMTTFVRSQSRRQPVRPAYDGRMQPFVASGRKSFVQRIGLLGLSCQNCHGSLAGKRLGAQTLSQGQSNAFPTYKLTLGAVSSLHQQFQRCNIRVGAEPLELGADAYVNLEAYLAYRGVGLPVETPGVRD